MGTPPLFCNHSEKSSSSSRKLLFLGSQDQGPDATTGNSTVSRSLGGMGHESRGCVVVAGLAAAPLWELSPGKPLSVSRFFACDASPPVGWGCRGSRRWTPRSPGLPSFIFNTARDGPHPFPHTTHTAPLLLFLLYIKNTKPTADVWIWRLAGFYRWAPAPSPMRWGGFSISN